METTPINILELSEVQLVEYIREFNDFTEREVRELMCNFEYDRIEGSDRRWSKEVTVILHIADSYFSITYDKGLTECQEDYFDTTSLTEVEPYEETIIMLKWRKKNGN